MKTTLTAGLIALVMTASAAAAAQLTAVNSNAGEVIAAAKSGMTLYTFRNDSKNTSNCYGDCAQAWPPFLAASSDTAEGALKIISRKDGSKQWSLNGKPLYFWAGDSRRGDATGDGVGGVWDVVRR